jgi:hypothetical protein
MSYLSHVSHLSYLCYLSHKSFMSYLSHVSHLTNLCYLSHKFSYVFYVLLESCFSPFLLSNYIMCYQVVGLEPPLDSEADTRSVPQNGWTGTEDETS